MTVNEIFSTIYAHMIKGIMVHSQLSDYYDFLCLKGYSKCHEYHYILESCAFKKLSRYFIQHCNLLIGETKVDNPGVIPESWYKYTRQDVDMKTKMSSVKNGAIAWVNWEKETKELYQKMHTELLNLGEVALAIFVAELVEDVSCELEIAETHHLKLEAVDYDITYIVDSQDNLCENYKKAEKKLGDFLC